jgi:hypothetical protein
MNVREVAEKKEVREETVVRWITHGVWGILLNAEPVGNTWRITQADLDEFDKRLKERRIGVTEAPAPSASDRTKRAKAARERLGKKGVKVKSKN